MASNSYFLEVMKTSGLGEQLYQVGLEIAANAIELFADLPPEHPFFQQLAFMPAEDIPEYQQLLQKLRGKSFEEVSEKDRTKIIKLSFAYIEPRHRFGLLTPELMQKVVEVRQYFYDNLPEKLREAIERYDPVKYQSHATLMDNVLFGRIAYDQPEGPDRIRAIVRELLDELGLYDEVLDIGLDFNVGVGGRRLTGSQRQKLDVARALVKRADFIILNRPFAAVDGRTQDQLTRNVLEEIHNGDRNPAVLWVLPNPALAHLFERVVVLKAGAIAEEGAPETLKERNGIFTRLLA